METPDFGALSWGSSSAAGTGEAEKKSVAAAKGWKGVGEWQASRHTSDTVMCHACTARLQMGWSTPVWYQPLHPPTQIGTHITWSI